MPRLFYIILVNLAVPFILLRLFWRGRKEPGYKQKWWERFAFYRSPCLRPSKTPIIWLHAVSVGETHAAKPLIDALLERYPDHHLLLTSTTATGYATVQELYKHEPRILQTWMPYDLPCASWRFFRRFKPQLCIMLETEIWPNLLAEAARNKIPVMLANARLSRQSARAYARIMPLIRPALANLAAVAAQSEADANRLAILGAPRISVCGNLKFDTRLAPTLLQLGEDWKKALNRPIWLAASTREGEEALLLDLQRKLCQSPIRPLLVLVPRHPQRFDAVAHLLARHDFVFSRRSQGLPDRDAEVWLGDSMGEMPAYYRLADLAFIGGSLLPLGGQNLIEAAAAACPVLIGPHTFNFAQATLDAIATGAARRVQNAAELGEEITELLVNPTELQAMRESALAFAEKHRGATGRTMCILEKLLSTSPAPAASRQRAQGKHPAGEDEA
ncbi:MAG: lipid IV(A) 3-deoxy-D-manno-octulosonic acid transferase [Betaproteobacteria bacterium]|nr:lipid IV(A) 3-deoxy-D-manno-octulosonic acid transferase [Betaproteobacteria bacterium]